MFSFIQKALSRNPFSRKSREEKLVQNLKLLLKDSKIAHEIVIKVTRELTNDYDFTEDIAGQVAHNIDLCDIAQEFSTYDIAYEIDTSEIASEMDADEVAQYIEMDTDEVAQYIEINYDELVCHMDLDEFAQVIDIESLAATTAIQDALNDIKENIISDVVSEIKDRLDD